MVEIYYKHSDHSYSCYDTVEALIAASKEHLRKDIIFLSVVHGIKVFF